MPFFLNIKRDTVFIYQIRVFLLWTAVFKKIAATAIKAWVQPQGVRTQYGFLRRLYTHRLRLVYIVLSHQDFFGGVLEILERICSCHYIDRVLL